MTTDTDNITLAINANPGAGTLAGTTVAAVAGTATFSDINIDNIGVGYTLDATVTGLTTATSNTFNISQTATQLVITQEPTDAVAGVNIAPSITVEIRDATNNLVASATDNVTLAFNTDPSAGAATLGGTLTFAAVGGIATFSDINIDRAFTGYIFDFTATGLLVRLQHHLILLQQLSLNSYTLSNLRTLMHSLILLQRLKFRSKMLLVM